MFFPRGRLPSVAIPSLASAWLPRSSFSASMKGCRWHGLFITLALFTTWGINMRLLAEEVTDDVSPSMSGPFDD